MYGGLTIARSTYAHTGYSLYQQDRTYTEAVVLEQKDRTLNITKTVVDKILLAPVFLPSLGKKFVDFVSLRDEMIQSAFERAVTFVETIVFRGSQSTLLNIKFIEKIVILEGKFAKNMQLAYTEVIKLLHESKDKILMKLFNETLLLGESFALAIKQKFAELIVFAEGVFEIIPKRVFKETLILAHKSEDRFKEFFREVIKLVDGRTRLPDLLAGIGSTLYASSMYAYSDLAPRYLKRFTIKVSKTFHEKAIMGDIFSPVFGFWRIFLDSFALADKRLPKISKTLQELVIIGDTHFATFKRLFRDTIQLGDKILRKLNGFYLTWSKAVRAVGDWTKRDRPESDWTKRDRPTRFE